MRTLLLACLLLAVLPVGRAFSADDVEPGLKAEFFNIGEDLSDFPDLTNKKATLTRVDKQINVESTEDNWPGTDMAHKFAIRWTGVVRIAKAGKVKFYTQSDDGSKLLIDGKQVVDNGGLHGMDEKDGEVELTAGDHTFEVDFFENDGGHGCIASWEADGVAKQVIPDTAFFHKK